MSEHEADPDRPRRNWRIPTRIYGRVRTSTVLLGICFVLTAMLYGQVRPEPEGAQTGPQPIDTSQYTQTDDRSEYVEPSTPVSPTPTVDPSTIEPGTETETEGTPGQTGSPTGETGTSTTTDPTYLPGMTVPQELRSLFPPAPQAPSATGTP